MLQNDYEALAGDLRQQAEEADGDEARELYRRSSTLYRKAAEKADNRVKADALHQLSKQLRDEASSVQDEGVSVPDRAGEEGSEVSYFSEPPDLEFLDVGGMDELKQVLRRQVIHQFQDSGFREDLGVSPTNGLLLYGPPGTGKTYVSKALAGELGFRWAEVDTADLVSKYVGEAAKNVQELFDQAKRKQPCVIFLDEIDAVAGDRGSGGKTDSEQQMVNQLLKSLERIQGEDILVLAATNRVEAVDAAIRRSGRFDEKIHVPLPDKQARYEILKVHLRDREHRVSSTEVEQLAAITSDCSASDLQMVVEQAAQKAHIDSLEDDCLQPITYKHLVSSTSEGNTGEGGEM